MAGPPHMYYPPGFGDRMPYPGDIYSLFNRSAHNFEEVPTPDQATVVDTATGIFNDISDALQHGAALEFETKSAVNRLFQVEEQRYAAVGSKILPGMKRRLLPHELTILYQLIQGVKHEDGPSGLCLPQPADHRLFDSHMLLSLCAVIRLGHLIQHHIEKNRPDHLSGLIPDEECKWSRRFGLQCLCEKDNILRGFIEALPCGPTLLLVPDGTLDSWQSRVKEELAPVLEHFPRRFLRTPFLTPVTETIRGLATAPQSPTGHAGIALKALFATDIKVSSCNTARGSNIDDFLDKPAGFFEDPVSIEYVPSRTSEDFGSQIILLLERGSFRAESAHTYPRRQPVATTATLHMHGKTPTQAKVIMPLTVGCILSDERLEDCRGTPKHQAPKHHHILQRLMAQYPGQVTQPPTHHRVFLFGVSLFSDGMPSLRSVYSAIQPNRDCREEFQKLELALVRWIYEKRSPPPVHIRGEPASEKPEGQLERYIDMLRMFYICRGPGVSYLGQLTVKNPKTDAQQVSTSYLLPGQFDTAQRRLVSVVVTQLREWREKGKHWDEFLRSNKDFRTLTRAAWCPEVLGKEDAESEDIDWMYVELSRIIKKAANRASLTQRRKSSQHVVIFCQDKETADLISRFGRQNWAGFAEVYCITTWPDQERDQLLRKLGDQAATQPQKSIVVLTTLAPQPRVRDALAFASVIVIAAQPVRTADIPESLSPFLYDGREGILSVHQLARQDNLALKILRLPEHHRAGEIHRQLVEAARAPETGTSSLGSAPDPSTEF